MRVPAKKNYLAMLLPVSLPGVEAMLHYYRCMQIQHRCVGTTALYCSTLLYCCARNSFVRLFSVLVDTSGCCSWCRTFLHSTWLLTTHRVPNVCALGFLATWDQAKIHNELLCIILRRKMTPSIATACDSYRPRLDSARRDSQRRDMDQTSCYRSF